jgi:glycosyltransferase involved in cell wall biosynthesis
LASVPSALPARRIAFATPDAVGPELARPDHRRAATPSNGTRISATILTRDSAKRLESVLEALRWCDEVIVLDTGSHDTTVAIARSFANVRVHQWPGAFPGFGVAHRHAVGLAKNDWILSIDSDEIVSPELCDEIAQAALCSQTVYSFPFHNYFNGRLITSCGWYPDRHARLFDRRTTNFCDSELHEKVRTAGLVEKPLRHAVHHHSYASSHDFLRKMHAYSALFAAQNAHRRKSGAGTAIRHAMWTFVKSYLMQRGCLQGYEGLVISIYKSQVAFWKYIALHEANQSVCASS